MLYSESLSARKYIFENLWNLFHHLSKEHNILGVGYGSNGADHDNICADYYKYAERRT